MITTLLYLKQSCVSSQVDNHELACTVKLKVTKVFHVWDINIGGTLDINKGGTLVSEEHDIIQIQQIYSHRLVPTCLHTLLVTLYLDCSCWFKTVCKLPYQKTEMCISILCGFHLELTVLWFNPTIISTASLLETRPLRSRKHPFYGRCNIHDT